jgi:hypothetical protein
VPFTIAHSPFPLHRAVLYDDHSGVWRDLAADQNEFGLVALTFNPCTAV